MNETALSTSGIRRCGLTLFYHKDVISALAELREAKAKLLGVNMFEIIGKMQIMPLDILDLSPGGDGDSFYTDAKDFIERLSEKKNVAFELVWN